MRNVVNPSTAGLGAFLQQPLVTGVAQLSRDLTQAKQNGDYSPLLRVPLRAFDFMPAILRDVRFYADNSAPETRSSDVIQSEFSRIMGGIPGVDSVKRYNTLGEAEERYQAASNTLLNVFFNPATTTFVRNHPVASEVLRLAEATGEPVAPGRAPKTVKVNPTGRSGDVQTLALTNEDISRLQKLQGSLFTELARLEMARPDYFRWSDYQRSKSMGEAVAASQAAAKSILFNHRLYSIGPEGASMNRDALRAVLIGKAAGLIP
jgi:hypothetical protein